MPTITTSTQCVAVVRCLLDVDVLASKLFHDVGIFSRESFIQILRFNLDSVIVVLESEACRAAEAQEVSELAAWLELGRFCGRRAQKLKKNGWWDVRMVARFDLVFAFVSTSSGRPFRSRSCPRKSRS